MVEFRVLKGEHTVVHRKGAQDGEEILKPPSWQNSEANKHLFEWTPYDTDGFSNKTLGLGEPGIPVWFCSPRTTGFSLQIYDKSYVT